MPHAWPRDILRVNSAIICDVLSYLVSFVQYKKREKHPWRSFTFSKVIQMVPNRATHLICSPK